MRAGLLHALVGLSLAGCAGAPVATSPGAPQPVWTAPDIFGPDTPVPAQADPDSEGPLRVQFFTPIRDQGRIIGLTAIFSHDLHHDARVFQIDPPVPGHYQRVGPRAIEYYADAPFATATRFFVTVPGDLTAATGQRMDEEALWSFATKRPELISATAIPTESGTVITLGFNQPINLTVLERKLSIVARRKPVPYRLSTHSLPNDEEHLVQVTPLSDVPKRTRIQVTVQIGVQGTQGLLPSTRTERRNITTGQPIRVRRTACFQNNEARDPGPCAIGGMYRIEFDQRLAASAASHVEVNPPAPISVRHRSLWIGPLVQGGQAYEVFVRATLRDKRGSELLRAVKRTFRTPAARLAASIVPARVFVESTGQVTIPATTEGLTKLRARWWPLGPASIGQARRGILPVSNGRATGAGKANITPTGIQLARIPEGSWLVELSAGRRGPTAQVVVVNSSLSVRVWRDDTDSLVRVFHQGQPTAAEVAWIDQEGKILHRTRTDAVGTARLPFDPGSKAVRARRGAQVGYASAGLPIATSAGSAPLLQTARRAVRPGDRLRVFGTSTDQRIRLSVVDERGDTREEEDIAVRNGRYQWQWDVDESELPGQFTLHATAAHTQTRRAIYVVPQANARGLLELEGPAELTAGQQWSVKVRGLTENGAPMAGRSVRWTLTADSSAAAPEAHAGFHYGNSPAGSDAVSAVTTDAENEPPPTTKLRGEIVLDGLGHGTISVRPPPSSGSVLRKLALVAKTQDATAQITSNVQATGLWLGLRPSRSVFRGGDRVTVEATVLDASGTFQAGWSGYIGLEVWEPIKRLWRRVAPCRFDRAKGPVLCGFAPVEIGDYRLRYVAAPGIDDLDALATSDRALQLTVPLYFLGRGYSPRDPDKLSMVVDTPQSGPKRLLMLGPSGTFILPPDSANEPLRAIRPIKGQWELFERLPGAGATVAGLGGQWRTIGQTDQQIEVGIQSDSSSARPGDQIEITVRSRPGAHVYLEAVDERMLAAPPDPRVALRPILGGQQSPTLASAAWLIEATIPPSGIWRTRQSLPAGIGTHALVAIVTDAGMVGTNSTVVQATLPLLVTADIPAVVGIDDIAPASVELTNRTQFTADLAVQLGETRKRLTLKPGATQRTFLALPKSPGVHRVTLEAEPSWVCDQGCPPPGAVVREHRVEVLGRGKMHRYRAARHAGAALRTVQVPDNGHLSVRLSARRAPLPAPGMEPELSDPTPEALARAMRDTEAAASLDIDVTDSQHKAAILWAADRLEKRDAPLEVLAVACVIVTTQDPQRVRILADLEPMTRDETLPVWARAWLAVAWHRRLARVGDRAVVDRIVSELALPQGPVPIGPAGLGTTDLTRASILWALLQLRPQDPSITSLASGLEESMASGRPRGEFESWTVRLALARTFATRSIPRQPVPIEVWVDGALVQRATLKGRRYATHEFKVEPGTHQLLIRSPKDRPVWAAWDLNWSAPATPQANGLSLTRTLSSHGIKTQGTITVTHRVVVPAQRAWLSLEGGVPAGFDVVQGSSTRLWQQLDPGIYEHHYVIKAHRPGRFYMPASRAIATQQPWNFATTSSARIHVAVRN